MIRVLCVFSSLSRGGAESMCMNLYRNIDRNLVQFDFVKHTEAVGDYEEEIGVLGEELLKLVSLDEEDYDELRYRMGNAGASEKAAEAICDALKKR